MREWEACARSVFLRYNLIGGILWGAGVTLFGYSLGAVIPGIDRYLLPIILLIIVVSFLPIVAEMVKNRHAPKEKSESIAYILRTFYNKGNGRDYCSTKTARHTGIIFPRAAIFTHAGGRA